MASKQEGISIFLSQIRWFFCVFHNLDLNFHFLEVKNIDTLFFKIVFFWVLKYQSTTRPTKNQVKKVEDLLEDITTRKTLDVSYGLFLLAKDIEGLR